MLRRPAAQAPDAPVRRRRNRLSPAAPRTAFQSHSAPAERETCSIRPQGHEFKPGPGARPRLRPENFGGNFRRRSVAVLMSQSTGCPLRIICSINPAVYREAPSSRKAARHMSLQRRQHLFVALPEGGVINVSRKPRDILHIQGREPVQKALAGIQEILLREQG